MKRRLISFGESADEYLEIEATRLGISVPELVRRIVDKYREEIRPLEPKMREEKS